MPLPTTATLEYAVNPSGPISSNAAQLKVQNVDLSATKDAMLKMFGITVASDNTILAGAQVQRTIVFQLNAGGSTFFNNFVGDFATPFVDLFTHEIEQGAKMSVFASAPVIA